MSKWLLIIFVYINGGWVTADELIEGWQPSVYDTKQDCTSTQEVARLIESQNLRKWAPAPYGGSDNSIRSDAPNYHIPRRFECVPEDEFTGK